MTLISLSFVDNPMIKNFLVRMKLLVSIVVPHSDPLEQYLLDSENDMFMNERKELDEIFFNQMHVLKHNLHAEILGDPPPPKVILCLN